MNTHEEDVERAIELCETLSGTCVRKHNPGRPPCDASNCAVMRFLASLPPDDSLEAETIAFCGELDIDTKNDEIGIEARKATDILLGADVPQMSVRRRIAAIMAGFARNQLARSQPPKARAADHKPPQIPDSTYVAMRKILTPETCRRLLAGDDQAHVVIYDLYEAAQARAAMPSDAELWEIWEAAQEKYAAGETETAALAALRDLAERMKP